MKSTILTTAILVFFLLPFSLCFAQKSMRVRVMNGAPSDSTSIEELFSQFDLSDVPTGFLLEAGMPQLDLTFFDGEKEDVCTDFPTLYSIVKSVESIDVSNSREWGTHELDNSNDHIPLWVALYRINGFSKEALEHVSYQNHHFIKQPAAGPEDLYESHNVMAFAPTIGIINEGAITFKCELTSHSNLSFTRLELDADDGLGFRAIAPGQLQRIYYGNSGTKKLRLKVYESDSSYNVISSNLFVKDYRRSPSARKLSHHADTLLFSGEYRGDQVAASVTSVKNRARNHVFRPLIIVEGFDPLGLDFSSDSTKFGGFTHLDLIEEDLTKADVFANFDVYYIDWHNSEADIRANAILLQQIIEAINQEKHTRGSSEPNIVIAQSMGGLITQYALRELELQENNHEVGYLFSHDVPYYGATVPLGVIYTIQTLLAYIKSTNVDEIIDNIANGSFLSCEKEINKYLYSKSAQQMLTNYVNRSRQIDHTLFNELQHELRVLGLPKGDVGRPLVNIAVSNGGSSAPLREDLQMNGNRYVQASASFSPCWFSCYLAAIFNSATKLTGDDFWGRILSYFPGLSNYSYRLDVYAHTPENHILSSFVGVYTNWILFIPIQRTFIDEVWMAPSSASLELANGSYYDYYLKRKSGNPFDTLFEDDDDKWIRVLIDLLSLPDLHYNAVPKIQFIPLFSSLRYLGGESTPNRDYKKNPLLCGDTEFDGYFLPDTAQYHIGEFCWNRIGEQTQIFINSLDTIRVGSSFVMENYVGETKWVAGSNAVRINEYSGVVEDILYESDIDITGYGYSDDYSIYVSRTKRVHAIPRECPKVYLEPHFHLDTLIMEVHSLDPVVEHELRDNSILIEWFFKKDIEPLREFGPGGATFVIPNFSTDNCRYKITLAAHVNSPANGLHYTFVDYTFWNNQRIHLVQPQSIILCREGCFLTSELRPGYYPLFNEPLLVSLDPEPLGDYTDRLISESIVFRDGDAEFACTLDNNNQGWGVLYYFRMPYPYHKLQRFYNDLEEGEIGLYVVEMVSLEGGDPIQSFHIPVIKRSDLTQL